ncbi:MAG: TonB-dependent receptor, partial [Longimicrobiales bacterium]
TEAVAGTVTRVLSAELGVLSSFLNDRFQFDPGSFDTYDDVTPAKRYLLRTDLNLSNNNKISFRYNQLDSSSASNVSGSSSAGLGRATFTTSFLNFAGSNYTLLENIKSGIGEWNWVIGSSMANNLIGGYTTNDESRGIPAKQFPFVEILAPDGTAYTAFGTEPFTMDNELRYNTFQLQDNFTKFSTRHTLTFGATLQRYQSDNVFWSCCPQSDYVYSSLADFYADANDFLANPNRTMSPVALRRFKLRYSNIPGLDKPLQVLKVLYTGAYAQDEWRPARNVTITAGVRFDIPYFENTAYANAKADSLTFRDEDGAAVQYSTGKMPDPKVLWSPRFGFNWDVASDQRTQVRGGTGIFTGPPLYVWISNQLGNTGVLIGEFLEDNVRNRPFHPDTRRYWPANVSGEGAPSYELNVTDQDFKFPQVWRNNIAVDRRLPWDMIGTVEFLYNKDINGIYYINANQPAAQTAFTGVDNRPRWTANRLNNTPGNAVTSAMVMKNQSVGSSWNISTSLSKPLYHGLAVRGAYSYGEAKNTIDPGSTAFSTFANNQHAADPNNPGVGWSNGMQGHRVFVQTSYTRSYFNFGATTIAAFWEAQPSLQNFSRNASYVFAG